MNPIPKYNFNFTSQSVLRNSDYFSSTFYRLSLFSFLFSFFSLIALSNCSTVKAVYVNDPNSLRNNNAIQTPTLELDAVNGELTLEITDDNLEGVAVLNRNFFLTSGEEPRAAIYKAVEGKKVDGIFITRFVQEDESSFLGLTGKTTTRVKGRGIKIKYVGIEKSQELVDKQILLMDTQLDFKRRQIELFKSYIQTSKPGEKNFLNFDLNLKADKR